MDKEPKKMNYAIDVTQYIRLDEAIIDGKTKKEAAALKGEWIKINETMFAFVEDNQTTMIRTIGDTEIGSSGFDPSMKLMDKYMIAFKDLKNAPQRSIESKEYRWLQEYLFSQGWYSENRYLYPPTTEPEVVAELPSIDEKSVKLDPMNKDNPLDIGVGEDEPKMTHYVCPRCGKEVDIEESKLTDWKLNHMDNCTSDPDGNDTEGDDPTPDKPPKREPVPKPTIDAEQPKPVVPNMDTPAAKNTESKTSLIDTIKKYVGNDVLEVFGDTGSGKSKFALEVAREAINAGMKVFYLDSERNLTDDDVKMLGKGYKYTPVLKEIDSVIQKLPPVDIVIVDSIGFPILTAYARYSMKQKGDALLTMIAMFGDLKQWAYRNNGLVIVVNQPESTFNKESGHILRPFGDKSQFAAKEIWWMKMIKRADKTPDRHTEILITSFRGRTLGYGDKLYTMNIRGNGIEFVSMR